MRADGRIPCWTRAGINFTHAVANLDHDDFVGDVLNAPSLRKMRLDILLRKKKFIEQCSGKCELLTQGEQTDPRHSDSGLANVRRMRWTALRRMLAVSRRRGWPLGSIDWINWLQIEPLFLCNLRCPACFHGGGATTSFLEHRRALSKHHYTRLLDSLLAHTVSLRHVCFVGVGEPTLHPDLGEMIVETRNRFPSVTMHMDTNANSIFRREYLCLDRIVCSIDGASADSYATYRVGGSFDKAISFVRSAVSEKKVINAKAQIVWKFILFSSNEHEVVRAQELASDLGVDELKFIIPWKGGGQAEPPKVLNSMTKLKKFLEAQPIFPHTTLAY